MEKLLVKKGASKLIKMLIANGGHWVEFVHKSGTKFYLRKLGVASFERPEWDSYALYVDKKEVKSKQSIEQIAEYLLSYNKD